MRYKLEYPQQMCRQHDIYYQRIHVILLNTVFLLRYTEIYTSLWCEREFRSDPPGTKLYYEHKPGHVRAAHSVSLQTSVVFRLLGSLMNSLLPSV